MSGYLAFIHIHRHVEVECWKTIIYEHTYGHQAMIDNKPHNSDLIRRISHIQRHTQRIERIFR